MIKDNIKKVVNRLNLFSSEVPEVSLVFFGKNILMEGFNIDTTEIPILANLVKKCKRIGIESITMDVDSSTLDIAGLIEAVSHPPADLSLYDDINTLLIEKRADKVYFNTVEFKLKTKGEEELEGEGWGEGFGGGLGEGFGGELGEGLGSGTGGESGEGLGEGKGSGLGKGLGVKEGGGGDSDTGGGKEFNVETFLKKECGLTGEEPPTEEANKVTKALMRLYDQVITTSGEEGMKNHIPVFNEIINSISPEAKEEILKNKIKLSKISAIIKSIIMTFSDAEIIEIFLSKTKLLGVFEARDLLEELSPTRLDKLLPDIKKSLSSIDIQEEYIKELEEALWGKGGRGREGKLGGEGEGRGKGVGTGGGGKGKDRGGGEGEGRGKGEDTRAGGEGGGSGRGAGVVKEFVKEFAELSYDEYSNKEISNFFRVLCSLGKGESNQVGKITDGFSNFVREFTRQYGFDALLNHSAKIKKTFQSAPDEIRNKVFLQILKKGKHVQITMARILLPLMKDETIAGGIINLLKENKRGSLSGFITSLDSERLSSLNNLLKGKLRKLGWAEKEIEKLWDELTSPSPITSLTRAGAAPEGPTLSSKGHGGISKRAYNRLYKRLKTGMDISEVGSLFQSLYKSLESESPEVKINALETITSVMDEIYAGEKITLVRRMVEELMGYAKEEKNTEVFYKFVEVLSNAGKKAEELNYEFIVKDIISFFAEAVGDNEKAKAIIPYLPNFKLTDARNVLLSLLWNKELRELVIGRIEDLGKESIPYLMELLKDTEEKDVRLALMNAIQSLGSEATEVVKEYLGDERWYVRRNAVRILGDIGGKEIVSDLYKLHSDDKRVQLELIRSLKRILKVDAESYILEFLESESPEVEKYAVTSLKNIIAGKSIPVLNKRLLKDRFQGTRGVEIKIAICDILKDEGGKTSIPPLSNIINSTKIFGIPKYSEDLRLAATMAVASIGGAKAKEILEPLKKDHSKKVRDFVEKII